MRILFIDDNEDLRALMALVLSRQGYSVSTADSAESALAMAPQCQPHLVVSDIGMPGRDGYELIQLLRNDTQLAPFRSIALTGLSLLVDKKRAEQAGFDECLVKPVDFDTLFTVLKTLSASLSSESTEQLLSHKNTEISAVANLDSDLDCSRFASL